MRVKPVLFFQSQDAILDVDAGPSLRAHATAAPHQLAQFCVALTESYDGVPDMLRMLVSWCDAVSLPGEDILCDAVAKVLHSHPTVVPNLQSRLLAHAPPHPLLESMLRAPRWAPTAAAIAAQHPGSALSFHVSRYRALADAGLSAHPLATPTDLARTIVRLFRETCAAGAPDSAASVATLKQKVALLATQDECASYVALGVLHRIAARATDPVLCSLARVVAHATEARVEELAPQNAARKRYALRLSALAAGQCEPRTVLNLLPPRKVPNLLPLSTAAAGKPGSARVRRQELDISALRAVVDTLLGSAAPAAASGGDIEIVEIVPPSKPAAPLPPEDRLSLARNLANPSVVATLFAALFPASGPPRDPGRRMALATLLTLAAAIDRRSDADLAAALAAPASLSREVTDANTTLLLAATMCEHASRPAAGPARVAQALRSLIRVVASDELSARGALFWASETLLVSGTSLPAVKRCLSVLEVAARQHLLLRAPVLHALREAFQHDDAALEPLKRADRREMLVKCLVGLVPAARMGTPIVRALIDSWLALPYFSAQHVRMFIASALGSIAPPYPPHFASALTALFQHPRVAPVLERDADLSRLVMEFRANAYSAGDTKGSIAV